MYRLVRRLIVLVATALLLQACSAVRLGYENADSLARWWLDRYLDLSPEQEMLARQGLARFHAWHRKTQLPEYLALLQRGQSFITGQPTTAEALALYEDTIRSGRILAEQANPDIADFLTTVTAEQIERLAARLAEKNVEEAAQQQLADGESGQHKARYQRTLERAEDWFGNFSSEQKAALRRLIDGQAAGSQFWFDERLRRQREWLTLVRQVQHERPPRARTMQLLRDYAARFDLPDEPARRLQALALRRAAAELAVAIQAMTSPQQRSHARDKLGALMRDFSELSQQGATRLAPAAGQ